MVAEVYFKLGILKEQMNDIMEQIRSCDDVWKEFKKLVKEKQRLEKEIRALDYKLTEWTQ
jgi:septal ring factor EnvC (AmiA/AmiB activator)